jgi:hypothetical protein
MAGAVLYYLQRLALDERSFWLVLLVGHRDRGASYVGKTALIARHFAAAGCRSRLCAARTGAAITEDLMLLPPSTRSPARQPNRDRHRPQVMQA